MVNPQQDGEGGMTTLMGSPIRWEPEMEMPAARAGFRGLVKVSELSRRGAWFVGATGVVCRWQGVAYEGVSAVHGVAGVFLDGLASAYNTQRCITCKTFARSTVKTIALSAVGYGMGATLSRVYRSMGTSSGGGERYYRAFSWARQAGRRAAVKRTLFGTHRYHWTCHKAGFGSTVAASQW
jgi:hypothetical protein